jgi:thioredoxin 1
MEDYEKIKGDFDRMIGGDTPVLVDFYATWCGPCKMMHPVLDDLKKQMGDSVHILKLDIDNKANIKVVQQFRIRSVPTLMLFRKGEMLWRNSGVHSAADLEKIIRES